MKGFQSLLGLFVFCGAFGLVRGQYNTSSSVGCACYTPKTSCPKVWPAPAKSPIKCRYGSGSNMYLVSTIREYYDAAGIPPPSAPDDDYFDDDGVYGLDKEFHTCLSAVVRTDRSSEFAAIGYPEIVSFPGFSGYLCDALKSIGTYDEYCVCNTEDCNRECPIDEYGYADEGVCVSSEYETTRDECPAPRGVDGGAVLVAVVAAAQATAGAAAIASTFAGSGGSSAASGGASGGSSAASSGGGGAGGTCVGTCSFRGRELCSQGDCTQNIDRTFPRLHHYRRSLFRNRAIWYGAEDQDNFLFSLFRSIPIFEVLSLHVAYIGKGEKSFGNQWLTSPLLCPCRTCHDVRPTLGQGLLDMDLMLAGYKLVTALGLRMAFSMSVSDLTAGGAIGFSLLASFLTSVIWRALVLPYTHDCAAHWTEKGRYRTSVGIGAGLQLISTVLVAVGSATGYPVPPGPSAVGYIFDFLISPLLAFFLTFSLSFAFIDKVRNDLDITAKREVPSYQGLVELYAAEKESDVVRIGDSILPLQEDLVRLDDEEQQTTLKQKGAEVTHSGAKAAAKTSGWIANPAIL